MNFTRTTLTLRRAALLLATLLLSGCFQVQLNGPVSNATVTITPLDNPGQVLAEATSWDSDEVLKLSGGKVWNEGNAITRLWFLGIFQLSLTELDDNSFYLVTASGGFDADANGDRLLDNDYTPVTGQWRAIMRGRELKEAGPKVTPLSEAIYLWLRPQLSELNGDQIAANLDRAAARLVKDVDEDGDVDYDDVLLWSPQFHQARLAPPTTLAVLKTLSDHVTAGGDDSSRTVIAGQLLPLEISEETAITPESYFADHIAGPVVAICQGCHIENGVAVAGGARLVFGPPGTDSATNSAALTQFLTEVDGGASLLLSKVQGVSHGGGTWFTSQSDEYASLASYIALVTGGDGGDTGGPAGNFWEGVTMADARQTLRRAALIFAGRLPTDAEYRQAETGEAGLRTALRDLMEGNGFHDFLIRAANDRLHTDGLIQGVPFDVLDANFPFYPVMANRQVELSLQERQQEYWDWQRLIQFGTARSPLELIAHVVENERPYTEILTADYMMANPQMSEVFRTGINHGTNKPTDFREGIHRGQIFQDEALVGEFVQDVGHDVQQHSGYLRYPHAGVLNTMAYLNRYPTTETNRNRARARWTYLHFLDVDIEKSASRTTDPEALADTNNPTMNNPACIVCHEVMDPVAGTFQNYSNEGWYRNAWGGMDSLPDTYKYPEVVLEEGSQSIDIDVPNGQLREFSVTEPLAADNWVITVLFTNPAASETEDLPRGMAIDEITVTVNGRDIFYSPGVDLLYRDDVQANGAIEFGGQLAIYLQDSYVSFPVHVPTSGDVKVTLRAAGNTLADNIAPNVRIGFSRNSIGSLYVEGDTWFRDMRPPGLPGEITAEKDRSLQWLGQRIASDPRFARATVKFWWPGVMGADVLAAPASTTDAGYQQLLNAFEQQTSDIQALADGLVAGFDDGPAFNLKDLLVEMAMSGWFRANGVEPGADNGRARELETVGTGRLLTPAELENKTRALLGFGWGEWPDEWQIDGLHSNLSDRFRIYYGGIDSVGVKERARELTTLMSNVATRQALEVACRAVVEDFASVDDQRRLFAGISHETSPGEEGRQSYSMAADYSSRDTYQLNLSLEPGNKKLRIIFDNSYWDEVNEIGRQLIIDRVRISRNGVLVRDFEGEFFRQVDGFELKIDYGENGEVWDSGNVHTEEVRRNDWRDVGWVIWGWQGWVSLPLEISEAGEYQIEVIGWGSRVPDGVPARMTVSISDSNPYGNSSGSSAIREKIRDLYKTVLGRDLPANDPELEMAFEFLTETWLERMENLPDATGTWRWPDEDCLMADGFWEQDQAVINSITADPALMKGSWAAFMNYLMTHYDYLHE